MLNDRLNWFQDPKHKETIASNLAKTLKATREKRIKASPQHLLNARKWAKANPDKVRESQGVRRSRLWGDREKLSPSDRAIMRTIYQVSERVSRCLGIEHQVDHVIPLSRGGRHCPSNLQAIPATLNHWKSSKTPQEFAEVLALHKIII
jgi:5-methylcytosine-specific restriction endonuclease McrA